MQYIKRAERRGNNYKTTLRGGFVTCDRDVAEFFFAMEKYNVKPKELCRQIQICRHFNLACPWDEITKYALHYAGAVSLKKTEEAKE